MHYIQTSRLQDYLPSGITYFQRGTTKINLDTDSPRQILILSAIIKEDVLRQFQASALNDQQIEGQINDGLQIR